MEKITKLNLYSLTKKSKQIGLYQIYIWLNKNLIQIKNYIVMINSSLFDSVIMTKTKWTILTIIWILILILIWFIYRDITRCYEIQWKRNCKPYDLTTIENEEYIDFYHWLNEKCLGKCGTAKLKLKFDKRLCRYKYKRHVEASKDRVYFRADTYNPCPELYTIPELNEWMKGE